MTPLSASPGLRAAGCFVWPTLTTHTHTHMLTHTHHTVRDSSEKLTFIYAPVWYDYKEKLFDNTELT